MIKAQPSDRFKWFFLKYLKIKFRNNFHSINIHGEWRSTKGSGLIIGNHISWWDGFWVLHLMNQLLPDQQLYVMMLESELQKHPFLRKLGAFSIQPGSKDLFESLNYAKQKIQSEDCKVLMYPQGILSSQQADIQNFNPGAFKIIQGTGKNRVLFYTAFSDYFDHEKPQLDLYIGEQEIEMDNPKDLELKFHAFYSESRKAQSNIHI